MRNKLSLNLKRFLGCKLCWQLALILLAVLMTAELIMLYPYYRQYKEEQFEIFENNNLQIARVLAENYSVADFPHFVDNLGKYTSIKGGAFYDKEGKIVKKFGNPPEASPADFENFPTIGEGKHQFYLKNKNIYYTLWDKDELGEPYSMVAVIDVSSIQHLLNRFIRYYWNESLYLLIALFIAAVIASEFFIVYPIRKAYKALSRSDTEIESSPAIITELPNNELGFIFNFINALFEKLHGSLKILKERTKELHELNATLENKVILRTEELTEANKALSAMALFPEQHSSPIFRVDTHGKILYANVPSIPLFQFWACERSRILPEGWTQFAEDVNATNTPMQIEVVTNTQIFLLDFVPVPGESYVNVYGSDISERKKIEKENQFLQYHNPITKLYNSYFFKIMLEERKAKAKTFAVLLLQVNDIVSINQNLGHATGDAFLAKLASVLTGNIPADTLLGHFSHNIFAIILFDHQNLEEVNALAFHLLSLFSISYLVDEDELRTSVNIGISLFPTDSEDSELLLQYADMALLQARNHAVDTLQFFTKEINAKFLKSHELYQDLHHAVLKKQLSLVYQPQLNLQQNKIVGMETLIRWNHPKKGLISPDEFIHILEDSSLIFLVTEWIFETAIRMLLACEHQGFRDLSFSINLTSKQLNQENLLEIIQRLLNTYIIKPSSLEIEITERASLVHPEESIKTMHELKKLGIKIAIDDFGSDYSSLKYLLQLPLSKIKIDKAFIHTLVEDPNNQAIVKAVIELAKQLKLSSLAEGVETHEQMKLLKNFGCDEIQGYVLAKPMNAEELLAFMKKSDLS